MAGVLTSPSGHFLSKEGHRDLYFKEYDKVPDVWGCIRAYRELRYKTHLVLEEPASSTMAFCVTCSAIVVVILSCVAFVLETVPQFSRHHPFYKRLWESSEAVFASIFTVEYLCRLWATNLSCRQFIIDKMNLIDFFSVIPFWLQHALSGYFSLNLQFLRVVRLVRIFKIFQLGQSSFNVRLLTKAVLDATDTLALLTVFLTIAVFVFASFIWYAERGIWTDARECFVQDGDCSEFQSIPLCFYWAATTMTTVGYGDMSPLTTSGRAVASAAMILGILVIAMPVSVLGGQFQETYTKEHEADRLAKFHAKTHQLSASHTCPDHDPILTKAELVLHDLVQLRDSMKHVLPNVMCLVRERQSAFKVKIQDSDMCDRVAMHDSHKTFLVADVCGSLVGSTMEELTSLTMFVQEISEEYVDAVLQEGGEEDSDD